MSFDIKRTAQVSLIPGGDRGERRITHIDLMSMDPNLAAVVDEVLRREAQARGLDLQVWHELPKDEYVIRWQPARDTPPNGGTTIA